MKGDKDRESSNTMICYWDLAKCLSSCSKCCNLEILWCWPRTQPWSCLIMQSDFLVHPTIYTRLGFSPTPNPGLLRLWCQSHLYWTLKYLQQGLNKSENTQLTFLLIINTTFKSRRIKASSIDEPWWLKI